MLDKLPQDILDRLSGQQKAEYAVHHNAVVNTMRAYNQEPTAASKRNWDSARQALAEFVDNLKNPTAPASFKTQQQVLSYLQSAGYKVGKSALSNHVRSRLLAKRQGVFRLRDVESYAQLQLRDSATDQTAADKKTSDLQARKLRAEISRIEEQALKAVLEREIMEGKYVPADSVEQEIIGRALVLKEGQTHTIHTYAAEWVALAGGDQARVADLEAAMLEAFGQLLHDYAALDTLDIILTGKNHAA